MAKRNPKLIAISVAVVACLSFAGFSAETSTACTCSSTLDKTLPVSHPANRCAVEPVSHVSWFSWITGSHSSKQFHYLDLLELLTRSDDDNSTRHTTG
ncbi:MAG: hypothetical protein ACFHVJ_01725 [Aestuariibacter sp.]